MIRSDHCRRRRCLLPHCLLVLESFDRVRYNRHPQHRQCRHRWHLFRLRLRQRMIQNILDHFHQLLVLEFRLLHPLRPRLRHNHLRLIHQQILH